MGFYFTYNQGTWFPGTIYYSTAAVVGSESMPLSVSRFNLACFFTRLLPVGQSLAYGPLLSEKISKYIPALMLAAQACPTTYSKASSHTHRTRSSLIIRTAVSRRKGLTLPKVVTSSHLPWVIVSCTDRRQKHFSSFALSCQVHVPQTAAERIHSHRQSTSRPSRTAVAEQEATRQTSAEQQ